MLGNGHQLHVGEAHLLHVAGQLLCHVAVGEELALQRAPPGAEVDLVDVGGVVVDGGAGPPLKPGSVAPLVARQVIELGGGAGTGLGVEGVGVGLQTYLAVRGGDGVLINVVLLHPVHMDLPDAVAQGEHGGGLVIPAVEVAHQGNGLGVGGPDPEGPTLLFGVGAQVLVGVYRVTGGKLGESVFFCTHSVPPDRQRASLPLYSSKLQKLGQIIQREQDIIRPSLWILYST